MTQVSADMTQVSSGILRKGVIHLPCACFVQSRDILNLVFRVLFTVEMDLDLAARAIHLLRPF
jgi:hypothetical protein